MSGENAIGQQRTSSALPRLPYRDFAAVGFGEPPVLTKETVLES